MSSIAFVNGDYLPEDEAKVSIFDRGFLFADAIYEVVPVVSGKLVELDLHMQRLRRGLNELHFNNVMPLAEVEKVLRELVERNAIREGRVYMQITRGVQERSFSLPQDIEPTLIAFAREAMVLQTKAAEQGIRVKTLQDLRWGRRDIKTVMLLPASLSYQHALDDGFDDAWLIDGEYVTEGTSNNAFIVKDGKVYTRMLSPDLLPGCTRQALLLLAQQYDVEVIESPFTVEQAYAADEAFVTSASALVTPVVQIDDVVLSGGVPGELTLKLREIYVGHLLSQVDG